MEFIAPVLIVMTVFTGVVLLVRTVANNRRQLQVNKMQVEMHTRLIDKFGGSEELIAYLGSPAGQKLVESATLERRNPFGRILGSVQAGLVLTLAGAGFLVVQGRWPEVEEGFLFLGVMGVALGLGFLLSAAAAYFLSKSWGLIDDRGEARSEI